MLKQISTALAVSVLTLSAAATVSPATATPMAEPKPDFAVKLIVADLTVTNARVQAFQADNNGTLPTRAWVVHRTQTTGLSDIGYGRAESGYCLLGWNPRADLGDTDAYMAGTGIDGVVRVNEEEAMSGDTACAQVLTNYQRQHIEAGIKSDLKNAATATETYITDHPFSSQPITLSTLARYGFVASPGNKLDVWGSGTNGYCLRGTNPKLPMTPQQGYWYDSTAGGLSDSLDKSTDKRTACGQAEFPDVATRSVADGSATADSAHRRDLSGGVPGVITGTEITAFMVADLSANKRVVNRYRVTHNSELPPMWWANQRTQHTGKSESAYLAPKNGNGYCLYSNNPKSLLGAGHSLWAGTGIRNIKTASNNEMAETATACGRFLRELGYGDGDYPTASDTVRDQVTSDVKHAATAAETHATDYPAQTTRYTLTQLKRAGFEASEGTTVRIWGSPASGYCLLGTNPKMRVGENQGVWYDSTAGGVRTGTVQPKDGFCSRVRL